MREIAHLFKVARTALVYPAKQLRRPETLLPELFAVGAQSVEIKFK